MRPLRGLQETRVATREESGVLGFPSRHLGLGGGSWGSVSPRPGTPGARRDPGVHRALGAQASQDLWGARGSPASPRGEALFRCAEPSRVPRGPANYTASLTSQRERPRLTSRAAHPENPEQCFRHRSCSVMTCESLRPLFLPILLNITTFCTSTYSRNQVFTSVPCSVLSRPPPQQCFCSSPPLHFPARMLAKTLSNGEATQASWAT